MKVHYVIKDYTDDDFSETYEDGWLDEFYGHPNLGGTAQVIAERHFYDDPCKPHLFECVVGVKVDLKDEPMWFKITAQASIEFDYKEI